MTRSTLLVCIVLLASCQDTNDDQEQRSDAGWTDARISSDQSTGERDTGAQDAGAETPCEWASQCPGGDCIDRVCRYDTPVRCTEGRACPMGESCSINDYRYCATPCELDQTCPLRPRPCASGSQCPRSMLCVDGLCINECVTDVDCGSGHCIDGQCQPFPDVLNGASPPPLAEPGEVRVGVASIPLNFPVGVSMAGYIAREGPSTPYNDSLGGSDRVLERQDVRALVLATSDALVIFLRLPLCWSTDYLRTLTAIKLQALTVDAAYPNGINYLDHLVTGATHSHSQPGRFWHLVPSLGAGFFGFGTFSLEMVNRYADHFARAIKRALDNLQVGRVGWHVIDQLDPDGRIHGNRRDHYGPEIDERMMVLRVEDQAGRPVAGLINMAVHGTLIQKTTVTGDVAGGIEWAATNALSGEAGRLAPVLFMNGNAGNVRPSVGDSVEVERGRIQLIGQRVLPHFLRAWEAAEPADTLQLEVVTRRIPVTYDLLGYDRENNEFRDPVGVPYLYGGYFCVNDPAPQAGYSDGALGCRAHVDLLGTPVPNAHKAVLSAVRINDLVITTLPGEPTSTLGLRLGAEVEADAQAAGHSGVRSVNFGYSQDHHLYLLEADDWWQGGYEASNNWFGWRLGPYLVSNSRLLAQQLFTPETEENDTGIKPMWWPDLQEDSVTPTPGQILGGAEHALSRTVVRRGELLNVRWSGGHPGVDLPQVRLHRMDAGAETPALRPNGLPYDDSGFESMIRYEGDYEGDHTWSIRWEMTSDLAEATYALRIEGHAVQDNETRTYALTSDPFEVRAGQLVVRESVLENGVLAFKLNHADGPTNDDGENPFEALEAEGLILHVPPDVRTDSDLRDWAFLLGRAADPTALTVEIYDGGELVSTHMATGNADTVNRSLVVARAADGEETRVELSGWFSTRFEVPVDRGGPFDVVVTAPNGDRGQIRVEGSAP